MVAALGTLPSKNELAAPIVVIIMILYHAALKTPKSLILSVHLVRDIKLMGNALTICMINSTTTSIN
jgi:hypothetical protein